MSVTQRMREFLMWAQVAEPYAWRPREWATMHNRALKAGLVAENGNATDGFFRMVKYGLTQEGRKALLND